MPTFMIVCFVIVGLFVLAGSIFTFTMMFSSKARAKMMSKQVEASKQMIEANKDNIKKISDDVAEATKGATKTTARAIKEGFKDTIFCKHCGAEIEADSKFCKVCGKKL